MNGQTDTVEQTTYCGITALCVALHAKMMTMSIDFIDFTLLIETLMSQQ